MEASYSAHPPLLPSAGVLAHVRSSLRRPSGAECRGEGENLLLEGPPPRGRVQLVAWGIKSVIEEEEASILRKF